MKQKDVNNYTIRELKQNSWGYNGSILTKVCTLIYYMCLKCFLNAKHIFLFCKTPDSHHYFPHYFLICEVDLPIHTP